MDKKREGGANRKNLFVKDDLPVGFFFHRSIKNIGQREKLQADIEAYGGHVVFTDKDADTVLVDSKYDMIEALRDVYNISDDPVKRNVFVEKMSFVQHCIKYGEFKHRPPIIKRMGGQVGRSRVPFTPKDDEHLSRYIARKLPDVEAGGRKGEAIYLWLYEVAELSPKEYAWVYRHTADSWRERYRKNSERFDERIAEIVEQEMISRKQHWKEDRRMPRRGRRGKRMEMDSDSDEEEEEEEAEDFDEEGEVEIEEGQEPEREQDGEMQHQEMLFMPDITSEDERAAWDQQRAGNVISGQANKRKKSPLDTSVNQVVKRRRSEAIGEDSHVQLAKDKGKGKATTYEEEEEEEADNTIDDELMPFEAFEANDPGPSHTLSSPDRTLAENPARRQHSPEAFMTQATLVELNSPSRTTNFEPVSHSTSANKHHSANTSRSLLLSRGEEHLSPPAVQQPSSQRHRSARKTAQIARQQSSPGAPRPPVAAIPPIRRGPKPRPKPRPPLVVVQGNNEPPYRNTRSRSRSVEPVALLPTKPKRKTKRHETIPEEVEVEEVPATETQEEEMDVQNLLTTNSARQTTTLRAPSLETDDAQTRQDLAGSRAFPRRIQPLDILRNFPESSNQYSVPATQQTSMQPPALRHENQRLRQIRPQPRRPQMAANTSASVLKISAPRTPSATPRAPSTSSTESFPLPETRARAAKKESREQEKRTPFKPAPGTRAAKLYSAVPR